MKPYRTYLFRACAVVSILLVDAVESREVEIGADELESVYNVRTPINLSADDNNEGISPMLLGNVSEGEVDPKQRSQLLRSLVITKSERKFSKWRLMQAHLTLEKL